MKCEVCKKETRVNWGDAEHTLCELHSHCLQERGVFKISAVKRQKKIDVNNKNITTIISGVMFINLAILLIACLIISKGFALYLIFMPHYLFGVVIILIVFAFISCLFIGCVASILIKYSALNLPNLLSVGVVLSFIIGFAPSPFFDEKVFREWPYTLLLEDYMVLVVFYFVIVSALIMSWRICTTIQQKDKLGPLNMVSAPILFLLPVLLFGISQTSLLHEAATKDEIGAVKSALKPWKSINGLDKKNNTPLRLAIRRSIPEVVEFLLQQGAVSSYVVDGRRYDLLDDAIQDGSNEDVDLLLRYGANVKNSTALSTAVNGAKLDKIEQLLKGGADPNAQIDGNGLPIFGIYRIEDNDSKLKALDLLVQYGGKINVTSRRGTSLFATNYYMAGTFNTELADYLLQNGYNLNKHGVKTDLYYAARAKKREAVEYMASNGFDIQPKDLECNHNNLCKGSITPLHEAAYLSDKKSKYQPDSAAIIKILLQHGANPNVLNKLVGTPLRYAIANNNYLGAEALLKAGAAPNLASRGSSTPLEIAEKLGYTELAKLLMEYGAKRASFYIQ